MPAPFGRARHQHTAPPRHLNTTFSIYDIRGAVIFRKSAREGRQNA